MWAAVGFLQTRLGMTLALVAVSLGLALVMWDRIESGAESRVIAEQAEEANRARREAERAARGAERDGAAERLRTGGF
jgi:hypothetical protein